jgi:hypothetical protein
MRKAAHTFHDLADVIDHHDGFPTTAVICKYHCMWKGCCTQLML